MPTEFFGKHSTSLRLEMFTVMNEGFQRWDPAPKSAEAKAFLVIAAEDLSDGAFTDSNCELESERAEGRGKNGISHVAEPTEKQRALVEGCLENASRAMVNRLAEKKLSPSTRTKGRFNQVGVARRFSPLSLTPQNHASYCPCKGEAMATAHGPLHRIQPVSNRRIRQISHNLLYVHRLS